MRDEQTIETLLALFPPGTEPYEARRDGFRLDDGKLHVNQWDAWVLSFRNGHVNRRHIAHNRDGAWEYGERRYP